LEKIKSLKVAFNYGKNWTYAKEAPKFLALYNGNQSKKKVFSEKSGMKIGRDIKNLMLFGIHRPSETPYS